jgi:hypothetical protein
VWDGLEGGEQVEEPEKLEKQMGLEDNLYWHKHQ